MELWLTDIDKLNAIYRAGKELMNGNIEGFAYLAKAIREAEKCVTLAPEPRGVFLSKALKEQEHALACP